MFCLNLVTPSDLIFKFRNHFSIMQGNIMIAFLIIENLENGTSNLTIDVCVIYSGDILIKILLINMILND